MKKILLLLTLLTITLLVACGKSSSGPAPIEQPQYSVTSSSIQVARVDGIEYSIDNGVNWVSGEQVVFNNLDAETEYTLLYRYKASGDKPASKNGTLVIKTSSSEDPKLDKILIIGNDNSKDALTYFYQIVSSNQIESDLVLGHLYQAGATLQTHYDNALTDKKVYEYTKQVPNQVSEANSQMTVAQAILDETWDLIIVEQTSGMGGILREYAPHLNNLVTFIESKTSNQNVKIGFQMPWAFQNDSNDEAFSNYRNDQTRMYENIATRMKDMVVSNRSVDTLIPTGTAIQNLRTSIIRDTLTTDGLRLNQIGQLTAALTVINTLFEVDLSLIELSDLALEIDQEHLGAIIEAVSFADDKPLEITESVEYSNPYKDKLYMLSIGNSFTADSYVYLAEMLKDIGVKDFIIAYLYIGGSSLDQHLTHIRNNSSAYVYNVWNNQTTKVEESSVSIQTALKKHDWDIVTVQQASGNSGVSLSYVSTLQPLLTEIKANNPNSETRYGFHMTWAYAKDSDHWNYGTYNHNQTTMYEMIVSATKERVVPNKDIDFIIPAGTAIQNLRGTSVGDNVTRDGYHLNGLGQYTSGLTWIKTITNINLDKVEYVPVGVNVVNNIAFIKKAVDSAHAKPFELS